MSRPEKKPTLIQWELHEHELVREKADLASLKFTEYVRATALGGVVINRRRLGNEDRRLLAHAISQMNAVGSDLNRIAICLEIEGDIPAPREFFERIGNVAYASDAVIMILERLQQATEEATREVAFE